MSEIQQNELLAEDFILVDPPRISKKDVEKLIGTKLNDIDIYQTAFTHKSALKNIDLQNLLKL